MTRAREAAAAAAQRFPLNKAVLTAYGEVGLEIARLTKNDKTFTAAIQELKRCESETGDADVSRRISRLESRQRAFMIDGNTEFSQVEIEED
jgi:hypothetical protein